MTQALNIAAHPGIFADAEQTLNSGTAKIRKALADYRLYRRTLSELRALGMRQIEDIGFAGADLETVARASVANR